MNKIGVFVIGFMLISLAGKAQSGVPKPPSSLAPFAPTQDYAPKEKKSSKFEVTYGEQIKTQQKRKARAAKTDAKLERLMLTPQYSDPSYFGHKRPPKKRPVGKRKFCKVCGLVH